MRRLQCQCGESLAWDSGYEMGHPCQGCDKCGTTFATHPGGHKKRIPHKWREELHKNTDYEKLCDRCYAREKATKEEIAIYLKQEQERIEAA